MTAVSRRPRRSNQSLSIVRGIKTLKVYYWTTARLRKLLPRVFSTARQEHFAKAVKALKAQPLRTKEQILEDASRINPVRMTNGRYSWPKATLTMMREYADRAPVNGVDSDKLREALASMGDGPREEFMKLVIESMPAPRHRELISRKRLHAIVDRGATWLDSQIASLIEHRDVAVWWPKIWRGGVPSPLSESRTRSSTRIGATHQTPLDVSVENKPPPSAGIID
jgi:hypothetical protein